MKFSSLVNLTVLLSFFGVSLIANAGARATEMDFWDSVNDLMVACVVQPYSVDSKGAKNWEKLESTCVEVKATENVASFVLNGQAYFAVLTPSPYSDGDDLFNLTVLNYEGKIVAHKWNILAFGDPLYALVKDFRALATRQK